MNKIKGIDENENAVLYEKIQKFEQENLFIKGYLRTSNLRIIHSYFYMSYALYNITIISF